MCFSFPLKNKKAYYLKFNILIIKLPTYNNWENNAIQGTAKNGIYISSIQ